MRYFIVVTAYAFVAFLLGLAFLFPDRPSDLGEFSIIVLILIPVLAVFDLVGQTIIDSEQLAAKGPAIKPVIGLIALIIFILSVYFVVKKVAPATVPWF